MAARLYWLLTMTTLPRLVVGIALGSWIFELVTIVPSLMVVAGLTIAWRRSWHTDA